MKSPEQLALENGYLPHDGGSVVSPFGVLLRPFRPNKNSELTAIKFNHTEYTEDGKPPTRRAVTVYVHRLLWTHVTGQVLESSERVGFKDGNRNNITIANLFVSRETVEITPSEPISIGWR